MRYILLIHDVEAEFPRPDQDAVMEGYGRFSQMVADKGVMRAGDRLQPTATATTVRVRDGETSFTDGPFAETREQLGGYYILDCKDLDEALGYAAQIPSAAFGSIEVRPIWEM